MRRKEERAPQGRVGVAGASVSKHPEPSRVAGAVNPTSCEEVLANVIACARLLGEDTHETRRHLPSGRLRPGDEPANDPGSTHTNTRARLAAALEKLEPETALKLRRLMIAGRDGQNVATVKVNVSLADSDGAFSTMAADSGENGPLLVEYLLRGHAIACASGIDINKPLTDWNVRETDGLEERAWLSFGKQLASSTSEEWQCFAMLSPDTRNVSKLYVKLGKRAWWSFQAQLDRPTLRGAEKERRALTRRRFKGIASNDLGALVAELANVQGRALRRAARAIGARVGQASPTSR